MKSNYENVVFKKDKNKYKGTFKVGGKQYHAGYSHNPEELYIKTKNLRAYITRIQVGGKRKYLGTFTTPEEAGEEYLKFIEENNLNI